MSLKRPPNLSRFKKGAQGLIEFATLIEQADPTHREMILRAAEEEDPRFLNMAMRKVVYFDEIVFLDETVVAELLSKVSPKVLAYALKGMPAEFREKLSKQLAFREQKLVQDEEANLGEIPESFTLGARRQILKMARSLEAQSKFVFELANCPRFELKKKRA